jgi:hypothetical protein
MGGCDNQVLEKGFSYKSENHPEIGIPHKAPHIYILFVYTTSAVSMKKNS